MSSILNTTSFLDPSAAQARTCMPASTALAFRVLVVDDMAQRDVLKRILERSTWFEVVGEAAGGEEASPPQRGSAPIWCFSTSPCRA